MATVRFFAGIAWVLILTYLFAVNKELRADCISMRTRSQILDRVLFEYVNELPPLCAIIALHFENVRNLITDLFLFCILAMKFMVSPI